MNHLYGVSEFLFNGYSVNILDIFSIMCIGSAIVVITIKNPIISVLFLIGLFIGVACYLISIGMGFIGISYLLVYVGAISILFLFILMLINIRVSELTNETKNAVPLIFIVGLIFENANYIVFPQNNFLHDGVITHSKNEINITTYDSWESNLGEFSHINSIGSSMFSVYAIFLILTSIILLLAMVGAIVITVKRKNVSYNTDTYKSNV